MRKERLEQERRLEKKVQVKAPSAAPSMAVPNIYANTYYNAATHSRGQVVPGAVAMGSAGMPVAPGGGYYGQPMAASYPTSAGMLAPPVVSAAFGQPSASAWLPSASAPVAPQWNQWNAAPAGQAPIPGFPPSYAAVPTFPTPAQGTQPIAAPVVAPLKAEPASSAPAETSTASASAAEPAPTAAEDEEVPEIDEKQLVYSTMEGVKLLPQPNILKAELHEHQVRLDTAFLTVLHNIIYSDLPPSSLK